MHKKDYTPFPQLIVRLPRIKAPAAVTLGNGIRHAAETLEDLPVSLTQAISLMLLTHKALVEVWVARLATKKKNKKLQTIMRNERNAIRALYGYLLQLAKMDSEITKEISARAQTVIDTVFPKGMAFTNGNHAEVYAEMDRRFDAINTGDLRDKITSLGGHILLDVVETNHHNYLEELGGGVVQKEKYEENLRELMEVFFARVRMLVVHTYAWLDVCPERADDALMLLQTIETIGKMKDNVSLDGGPSLAQVLKQTVNAKQALTAKVNETALEAAPIPAMVTTEPSTDAVPKTWSPTLVEAEAEPSNETVPKTWSSTSVEADAEPSNETMPEMLSPALIEAEAEPSTKAAPETWPPPLTEAEAKPKRWSPPLTETASDPRQAPSALVTEAESNEAAHGMAPSTEMGSSSQDTRPICIEDPDKNGLDSG